MRLFKQIQYGLIGFLLFFTGCVSAQEVSIKQAVDFIEYQLVLTPDVSQQQFSGEQKILFQPLRANVSQIRLAAPTQTIKHLTAAGLKSYRIDQGELVINFETDALKINQAHQVTLSYLAHPSKAVKFYPDHVFTQFHTEQWMVVHQDIADLALLDIKLNIDLSMLTMVASGQKIAESRYKTPVPRPMFTFGFAFGDFKVHQIHHRGKVFEVLYRSQTIEQLNTMFADLPDIYDFYRQVSGFDLSQDKYTFVITQGGAMQEAAGFSLVGEKFLHHSLDEPRESWLISHELAHEWWGNSIAASSWGDFWLNEGLVQFIVAAHKAKQYGQDEYDRELILFKESLNRRIKRQGELKAVAVRQPMTLDHFKQHYRSVAYNKGAYIFHMLKIELGDELFWQGLRHYSQTFANRVVTTADFQQAMEQVAKRSLQSFFDTWVYRRQDFSLDAKVSYRPSELHIEFNQQGAEFVPLSWQLAYGNEQQLQQFKVNLTQANQLIVIPTENRPQVLYLDAEQYLPLHIQAENTQPYLLHNLALADSAMTQYWALKALVHSDYCQQPTLMTKLFNQWGQSKYRIMQQAVSWWQARC